VKPRKVVNVTAKVKTNTLEAKFKGKIFHTNGSVKEFEGVYKAVTHAQEKAT